MTASSDGSRNKKVLLVFPPFQEHLYGEGWKPFKSPTVPLGLMYIATPLIKAGYQVTFIDLTVDRLDNEQYFHHLTEPDFVLISCYTRNLYNVEKIIFDIKRVNKKAFIVCGGPYCTATGDHVEGSDLSVFGEADLIIAKILDLLSEDKPLDGIPGLSYKKNGRLIKNPGVQLIQNIDVIEPPSFHLARNKDYGYFYGIKIKDMKPLITSRGCPFRCTFCTFHLTTYRERAVDKVIEEMEMRVNEGARYILIYDDNFLMRRKRIMALMDKIIAKKFPIKMGFQTRVDKVDWELCKKLKQAGVILLAFGIESANQDILDFYDKRTRVEETKKAIALTNKAGIMTYGNIIIGAPTETNEHIDANKKFLKRTPLDFLGVHVLNYIYGSPLWQEAYEKGLINEKEMIVPADDRLSNFSYENWVELQNALTKSFYKNARRILRLTYKVAILFGIGYIFKVFKMFLNRKIYLPSHRSSGEVIKDVRR